MLQHSPTDSAPPGRSSSERARRERELATFGSLLADSSPLVQREVRRELERRGKQAAPLLTALTRGGEVRARTAARAILLGHGRAQVARRLATLALAPTVDLERGLLLLSRFEEPELDVRPYVLAMDAMAAEVLKRLEALPGLPSRAALLGSYLGRELGYRGDAQDYHHPDNVYLHRAIVRKRGLPLTLSALYLFVARRAGLRAAPVALPGHVILRIYEADGRATLLDPFHAGAALSDRDCLQYLAVHKLPFEPRWFVDATDRALLERHIGNLHHSYRGRGLEREVRLLECVARAIAPRTQGEERA